MIASEFFLLFSNQPGILVGGIFPPTGKSDHFFKLFKSEKKYSQNSIFNFSKKKDGFRKWKILDFERKILNKKKVS